MEHEMIDLLNDEGKIIGTIDKAVAHKEGQWHRSVHVWIVNDNNEILLAHRCKQKSFFADCWDCSFAGHIGAGESSIESALREGKEELGLNLKEKDLEFLFTIKDRLVWKDKVSNEFVDVYLIRKNISLKDLVYQEEEVDNVKWMKIEDFFEAVYSQKEGYLLHVDEEYNLLQQKLVKEEVLV